MCGVFVDRPTLRANVAQGLFLWSAVAHTRPAFPKNAYGPVGIPLIRGASGAGRWTQHLRREWKPGGKAPGGRRKIIQSPSHTRPDPRPEECVWVWDRGRNQKYRETKHERDSAVCVCVGGVTHCIGQIEPLLFFYKNVFGIK